jgi:hypothetical protein
MPSNDIVCPANAEMMIGTLAIGGAPQLVVAGWSKLSMDNARKPRSIPVFGDHWQWITLLRTDNQGRKPAEPSKYIRQNQVSCDWVLP